MGAGAGEIAQHFVEGAQVGLGVAGASVLLRDGHSGPSKLAHCPPDFGVEPRLAVVDFEDSGLGHLRLHELSGRALDKALNLIERQVHGDLLRVAGQRAGRKASVLYDSRAVQTTGGVAIHPHPNPLPSRQGRGIIFVIPAKAGIQGLHSGWTTPSPQPSPTGRGGVVFGGWVGLFCGT